MAWAHLESIARIHPSTKVYIVVGVTSPSLSLTRAVSVIELPVLDG